MNDLRELFAGLVALLCASIDGPLLYSTDTGDWGRPLAALELDEPVATSFLDNGRKFFAVNKGGEYVIGDAASGKQLLRGQLPDWPASYHRFQNRNDDLRPLSVRPTDSELLIADGKLPRGKFVKTAPAVRSGAHDWAQSRPICARWCAHERAQKGELAAPQSVAPGS